MSNYVIKYNQRFAVYKAFGGRCQWCHEPVDFKTFQVDHVLPEELLGDPGRLKSILKTYDLPEDFNINDYENWIPSHSFCNQSKSAKVYEGAPFIRTILDKCIKNKAVMQRTELMLNREPEKAKLLAQVQAAVEINLVNIRELQNFIINTDIMDSQDEDLNEIRQKLEQAIDYRAEKMITGIMDMVRDQTYDVVKSICKALGDDWQFTRDMIIISNKLDNGNTVRYYIENKVNYRYTVQIFVTPTIINNDLVIKFRKGDTIIDTIIFDLTKGVDWKTFRKILKGHYKAELAAKVKS